MPEIKYYYFKGACSSAPHILLNEAGVQFTPTPVVLQNASFPEGFDKLNPKMRVPVLILDTENVKDTTITEVPAISMAISNLAPEKHLMGKTSMEKVRVLEWLNWLSGTTHSRNFGRLFRPERFTKDHTESAVEAVGEQAKEDIIADLGLIEERLQSVDGVQQWAVGEAMTAVDVLLFTIFGWGKQKGFEMGIYPKYRALVKRLEEKESVKKTMKVEGLESAL